LLLLSLSLSLSHSNTLFITTSDTPALSLNVFINIIIINIIDNHSLVRFGTFKSNLFGAIFAPSLTLAIAFQNRRKAKSSIIELDNFGSLSIVRSKRNALASSINTDRHSPVTFHQSPFTIHPNPIDHVPAAAVRRHTQHRPLPVCIQVRLSNPRDSCRPARTRFVLSTQPKHSTFR
jgi:hypothetical protein